MATLLPAENMALTVARAQVNRGENPPYGTTTMLVLALDRLTGRDDWTEGVQVIDGVQIDPAQGEPSGHLPQHVGPSRVCVTCGQETGEDGRHVNTGLPLPGVTR